MFDAQSLLMQASDRSAGMFEADPMVWSSRPTKTKIVHQANQAKQLATTINSRTQTAGARFTEKQRLALAQARSQLSAKLYPLIAKLISEQLQRARSTPRSVSLLTAKPPSPAEIAAVAYMTATKFGFAFQELALKTQKTGKPPTPGTLVAMLFKQSAKLARWSPALIETLAPGIGTAFDKSESPAVKAFVVVLAIIFNANLSRRQR
jgi:hypothetical protein